MPSAGALCPPQITPIRRIPDRIQLPVNHIDVNSLIELSTESNNCKIFFTTDGTKPCPFQRKIAGREVTYKYIAPFTLKPGKRVLKAVCTTRDGLQESAVVTKTFNVSELIEENPETSDGYDYSSYSSFFETSDTDTSKSTLKSKSKPKKRQKSPTRKPRNHVTREAWASEGDVERGEVGATGDAAYPPIPDGPFNPTNYSGTQINVWGGAPPGMMNGQPGSLIIGGNPQPPYPVQYGFLTEQMIQKLNAANRPVTVGELRHLMEEASRTQAPPPPPPPAPTPAPAPAIEYKPVYKNPPLEPVSPGKGDFKGNLLHIYAHMLEHAKNNGDFRLRVAEPRMGKILEGKLEDEGDGYKLTVVLSKPGVPRGTVKKKKPPAAAPPPTHPPWKPTGSMSDSSKKSEKPEKPKKKDPPAKKDPYYAMETEDLNQEGTVVAYAAFNAEQDAEVLKQAMKGLGTDENAIINVLAYRSNPQRMEIVSMYKTMFGKDLIEHLKSELSGSFCDVAKFLCMAPAEFDAYLLRKAIKGLGTDEDVLIEVLCTRSNAQIQEIKKKYKEKFNKDLEKDIIGDTSGHFKRLLVTLVQASRSDATEVDRNKAHQDAKALYEAGEKKWGTDESKFNVILGSRSYPQLRAMFEEYKKISKKDIEDVLKSEMSGDILRGMLTIVRCVKNKFGHFARQLQKTMKGMGTDDDTLCRVVVSRCEIDMVQVKEEFEKLTGQTLQQYITDDISGDYRNIILALVTGGPPPASSVQSGKGFVEAVKNKTEEELDEEVRLETEKVEADPTVTPFEGFNAEQDAEALRKAMKGFGTDEKAIIDILAYRSNEQRVELTSKFKTMFGKELSKELSSELSGNFKTLCTDMLLSSAEFDAKKLNKAVKGLGTDEKVLVEIICTRTNEQLKTIKETYKTMFSKDLEADVASDTSGHFKRLLVACLQANRPEEPTFDRNQAKLDAQELLNAGEKKWGTDESRFNVILVSRSYAQLRATFQEYAKLANKDIEDTITSEMSGDLKEGFLAVVKCIRNKAFYFASELYRAMKGLGTDDDTLVRVVGSRCEVDMVQIKEEFQRNFKQTLGMFIKDDTSGDYRTMLLALIRDEGVGKKK
ncbi:annexin A6-like isoform X1 [Haliotis rufescens]|uniref:annexin A6-like isoform X1 n=1 Tax=Haliotis rufescens TaxID=6454 RepID=UPI00201E86CB|nr:annexin A6-like isoform X1 [Haliotis rufescens]